MSQLDLNLIREAIEKAEWKSYNINWVKPIEQRLFTHYKGERIMLQKFLPCEQKEVYYHNHPWEHIVLITKGKVMQGISTSYVEKDYDKEIDVDTAQDKIIDNEFAYMVFGPGTELCIHSPKCWHYFYPMNDEPVYSIMLTGEMWNKGPKAKGVISELSDDEKYDIFSNIKQYLENVE